MTLFLDVNTLGELVKQTGTTAFMKGLRGYMEKDFARWLAFDKSALSAAHSDVEAIELMPVADNNKGHLRPICILLTVMTGLNG